jgi:hypothetical protein
MTSSGVNLHSGDVMSVHMTYDGATLAMTITDATVGKSFTTSWAVNIPLVVGASSGYAGFTAGTGALTAIQEVLTWKYVPGPAQATLPAITVQPANQAVTAGQTATFTAAATGSPTPTVLWQVSTDNGTTFSILPGATSTTLSFTTASSQNGNQYQAVFTNSAGSATTTAATLTVNPATTKVPIQYEPENLISSSVSSGPTYRAFAWSGFTDGNGTILDASRVGDNVTITLNVPQAGTYDVKVAVKMYSSRGIMQLSVNGTNVGPAKDQYVSSSAWAEFDLGNVTVSSAGNQSFKFTVVGKNSASSGYSISFDYIKLTPQ